MKNLYRMQRWLQRLTKLPVVVIKTSTTLLPPYAPKGQSNHNCDDDDDDDMEDINCLQLCIVCVESFLAVSLIITTATCNSQSVAINERNVWQKVHVIMCISAHTCIFPSLEISFDCTIACAFMRVHSCLQPQLCCISPVSAITQKTLMYISCPC